MVTVDPRAMKKRFDPETPAPDAIPASRLVFEIFNIQRSSGGSPSQGRPDYDRGLVRRKPSEPQIHSDELKSLEGQSHAALAASGFSGSDSGDSGAFVVALELGGSSLKVLKRSKSGELKP